MNRRRKLWAGLCAPLAVLAAGWAVCLPGRAWADDPLDADPAFYQAAASFADGHYDRAAARLADLLRRYPRHVRLRMLLADACERSDQPANARQLYQAVVAERPDPRSAAIAAEAAARLTRRIESQGAAPAPAPAGADPFALRPEQQAAMSVVYPQTTTQRTEHFDITTTNPVLADVLAERVEIIFDRVRRTVLGDQLFPHRIELIVYPDQAAFLKALPAPHWCGGGYLFAPRPDGTARRAVLLWQVDDKNLFRASLLSRELPHELAHVVLREYFGQTACPLWLDEGLACLAESDAGQSTAGRMGELLNRQAATPLVEMIDRIQPELDRPASFYVEAASWTGFLRRNLTDAQMNALLGQLKDGQKPSVALSRVLFLDNQPGWLEAMERRWHESVAKE